MKIDKAKIKDVYVPLGLIGGAVILMIVIMLLQRSGCKNAVQLANITSGPVLRGLLNIILRLAVLGVVIPLLMVICDWFGHPFVSFWDSLLKLLSVAFSAGAIVGILGFVMGSTIPVYIGMAVVLGLLGYFFSDDAIEALIAIFLLYATYSLLFIIMPFITR
jgi:hypothetical protein